MQSYNRYCNRGCVYFFKSRPVEELDNLIEKKKRAEF